MIDDLKEKMIGKVVSHKLRADQPPLKKDDIISGTVFSIDRVSNDAQTIKTHPNAFKITLLVDKEKYGRQFYYIFTSDYAKEKPLTVN